MHNYLRFEPRVTEELGWYVYLLADPRESGLSGQGVFYVGKGQGNRVFAHQHAAEFSAKANTLEQSAKIARINEITSAGFDIEVKILRHQLRDEEEAFTVEAAAIDLCNSMDARLTNIQSGHHSGNLGLRSLSDVNATYGARELIPSDFGGQKIVLIKAAKKFNLGDGEDALYEATRQWWKVAAARRDFGKPSAPDWAAAVYRGVIRDVYKIVEWVGREDTRWGFVGDRTSDDVVEMRRQFQNCDASDLYTPGAQWPLLYFNCKM